MPELVSYDPAAESVLWYVVFTGERTRFMPWLVRLFLFRSRFRHVYALREYKGVTLIANQTAQGLLLDASPVPAPECVQVLAKNAGSAAVLFAGRLKSRYTPRGVQTCVSVVKSLLGLSAWHVWTPDQLYRYLIKHQGVELWQEKAGKPYK